METIEKKSKRLGILEQSLLKKEGALGCKLDQHFQSVKAANGQPLNDKRNGRATLDKWDKQSNSIRTLNESIEKTKEAISRESSKITYVERVNEVIPKEILSLVQSGELIQWRKHPSMFFVQGVDKARIVWDEKRKLVAHRYAHEIKDQDQRSKFVKTYNALHISLNPQA